MRRAKGRVGFKNCIREFSDRDLRSFKQALKGLLPDFWKLNCEAWFWHY